MAPKSPWGKKPSQNNVPPSGLPGLQPEKQAIPLPKTPYEEIQEDELIALSSIYGDDFRRIETNHGAWQVCIEIESLDVSTC
jgi:translation initiation factor 2-alpha kinase 4